MKLQSAALALAAALGMISVACSPSSGNLTGTAGTTGTGTAGTTGTGGTGTNSCPNVTACGGNVVGTWNVTSSCLKLNATNLDISLAGLDPVACTNVKMTGSIDVTGTWTAKADGTYSDATSTMGTAQLELPAGCLRLSGTTVTCDGISRPLEGLGFSSVNCVNAATGGCTCTGTIQHPGTLGLPSVDPQMSGSYEISGTTLTTDAVPTAAYAYCVSGNTLTMTPQSTNPALTGTIVLTKSSATGTGGTTGSGGSTAGTAGVTGTAGSTAGSGGSTGGTTTGTGGASAGRGGNGTAGNSGNAGRGGSSAGSGGSAGVTGTAGSTGTAGTTGTGGSSSGRTDGPCDIYGAANMPCGAAYSMVRALSKTYTGPLYQVRSGSSAMNTGSGGMLKDIPMLPDGFADTSVQDTFCSGTTCTVSLLYDHSGNGNNLPVAKKGLTNGGATAGMDDFESAANKGMMTIKGHKVYSLYMNAREGYRIMTKGKNVPSGSASQGIYELADGTHSGTACCWDFGNVTTNPQSYADMNTLFFGVAFWGKGAGSGPWMMADFEAGVWAGGSKIGDPGWGGLNDAHPVNNNNISLKVPFAFGTLRTSSSQWTLRSADLQTATSISTAYQGAMPKPISNAGAVVLGVGGDNSNNSWGTFYEGAIVAGYPTDATDLAVFNNIKAVGYTR